MLVWAGVIVIARVHFVNEPNAAQAHCEFEIKFNFERILRNVKRIETRVVKALRNNVDYSKL